MKLSPAAIRALNRYVDRALEFDPARFHQEAAYVSALFGRLDGLVFKGRKFTIEIKSTIPSDRGRGSAESIHGADFGIVAIITGPDLRIEKAVLGQAKRNRIDNLRVQKPSDSGFK